jgi:alpha-glucosidase
MAYLATSPLLVMSDDPQRLLDEPRLADVIPFLQALPVTWDETRVLEGSRIGELAVFARRSGSVWYVALVNGTADIRMVSLSPGFDGWQQVGVSQVTDVPGKADGLAFSSRVVKGETPLIVTLEPHGGFVAKLERK